MYCGIVQPERQLHPLSDLLLDQELRVDPDELGVGARRAATGLEQVEPCRRRSDRVVRPGEALLARGDDPVCEVAHVDHLRGGVGRRDREDGPGVEEALRPVREAPGGIPRADDQPGSRHERLGEAREHRLLAQRLERAVGRPAELLRRLVETVRSARPRRRGTLRSAYTEIDDTNV